jgi:hypothetical protein
LYIIKKCISLSHFIIPDIFPQELLSLAAILKRVPSQVDSAELAGYPWATGAEMACCTLLQILPRYNEVPSWRPPCLTGACDAMNSLI